MTAFLQNPAATVPGTKMAFAGYPDRATAQKVARYVLSLPAD